MSPVSRSAKTQYWTGQNVDVHTYGDWRTLSMTDTKKKAWVDVIIYFRSTVVSRQKPSWNK